MEILITGIFTIILLGIYASLGFIGFMFIQLISYRIFNFNIYKNLMKMLEVQAYENQRNKKDDLVLWSKPKRIKGNWFNAIIEKVIYKTRNIQFIMRCNYNELSYIVVSTTPLTKEDIDNININDYIFENGNPLFSRGIPYQKVGVA